MYGRRLAAIVAFLGATTALAGSADAEPLRWRPEWGVAQPVEYGVAVTFGALTLAVNAMPVEEAPWGPVPFDEAARGVLRLRKPGGRAVARGASDALFYGLMAYPVVVDTILVAGPRSGRVAWQMLMLDAQVLAVAGFTAVLLEHAVGRERPMARHCRGGTEPDPAYSDDCTSSAAAELHQSFPSGHTLMASAGAGLVCAHHGALPLYGGGAPDAIACAAALTGAAVQALLRVSADRHYLSDVLFGAMVGLGIGYGMPTALRYGADSAAVGESTRALSRPTSGARGWAVTLPLAASTF